MVLSYFSYLDIVHCKVNSVQCNLDVEIVAWEAHPHLDLTLFLEFAKEHGLDSVFTFPVSLDSFSSALMR